MRLANSRRLSLNTRRGEAHFTGAVVIDAVSLYHRVNGIARRNRIFQPFENHHGAARSEYRPLGILVKCAAVSIGRGESAFLICVRPLLWKSNRNAAGQSGITMPADQTFTSLCDGDERSGASSPDSD